MNLFELQINYSRQTGEDNPGQVKETYLVESFNPSNAEARLVEELKPFIFGDHEVQRITKRNIFEMFPKENADYWYKARVELLTIDGDKESRKAVTVLVQANTISEALNILKDETDMVDCEIVGLAKSPIIEVYRATNDVTE